MKEFIEPLAARGDKSKLFQAQWMRASGRAVLSQQRFSRLLGAELSATGAEGVTLELPMRDDLKQQFGFAHGGVVGHLADDALTYAGGMALGAAVVTAEMKVDHTRTAIGERLVAKATVVSATRHFAVTRCEVPARRGWTAHRVRGERKRRSRSGAGRARRHDVARGRFDGTMPLDEDIARCVHDTDRGRSGGDIDALESTQQLRGRGSRCRVVSANDGGPRDCRAAAPTMAAPCTVEIAT